MKYVIVIPDGCADEPQDQLGGRTPLEAAATPTMDHIAKQGIVGRSSNVPPDLPAGSEVANMSLMGYDPHRYFTGRAPLEAAAKGIQLSEQDWAIRCNLVTIQDQIMRDFTADHIATEDADALLKSLAEQVTDPRFEFVTGVSYRNLVLFRPGDSAAPFSMETRCRAPHDLTDDSVADEFPRGPGSDELNQLMSLSHDIFAEHEVNQARQAAGHLPATNVWLWGLGKRPALPQFSQAYGPQGLMITAVDLLRGIAQLIGWEVREVEGATGYLDTDYAAKGRAACEAIQDKDLVCVHVEAPDEASHEGRIDAKIEALEKIDTEIVKPIHETLQQLGDYRILISPDHPTPVRTKTHSHGFVPWAIAGSGIESDGSDSYGETVAGESPHAYDDGWKLMNFFIAK